MAAQLVHIAYAQKYLAGRPEIEEAAFWRGTTFPDIRRLAGIERDGTHSYGVTLREFEGEPDAWEAGRLLHSYLDEAWNGHFRTAGLIVDDEYPEKTWSAVKIAEETAFCGVMDGREQVALALEGDALARELSYGASNEAVSQWYAFVAWKLRTKFDLDAWRDHAVEIAFDAGKMERLLDRVEAVRHDPAWQERLQDLHSELGI